MPELRGGWEAYRILSNTDQWVQRDRRRTPFSGAFPSSVLSYCVTTVARTIPFPMIPAAPKSVSAPDRETQFRLGTGLPPGS